MKALKNVSGENVSGENVSDLSVHHSVLLLFLGRLMPGIRKLFFSCCSFLVVCVMTLLGYCLLTPMLSEEAALD